MKRSPMPRKRDKPRRNEGRVQHGRVKRRPADYTPLELFHVKRLASMTCCVPGCRCKAVAHHVMVTPLAYPKRCRRDHRYAVNVCDGHHTKWDDSVHRLGSEEKFKAAHGIDLFAVAMQEWQVSEALFERRG